VAAVWRTARGTFFLTDPPEQIRQHVQCVVLGGFNLKEHNTTLDAWLQSSGADFVATTNATLKVAEGLQPWYVVRLSSERFPGHRAAHVSR